MTQNQRVLKLLRGRLRQGLNTTDLHAPACDGGAPITRLAARIRDLRDEGHRIRSERRGNGTVTYFLDPSQAVGDATRNPDRPVVDATPAPLFDPPPQVPVRAAVADYDEAA